MTSTSKLFQPTRIGDIEISNRVIMAPLTRCRADEPAGDIPGSAMNIEYYVQRSNAGLIISEGTQVSPVGKGYMATPGIYSGAQVAGWKKITDAVHEAGSKIIAQIWHVGRITHPDLTGGATPIAPSAIKPNVVAYSAKGKLEVPTPHALTVSEIKDVVGQFRKAAANAIKAVEKKGFADERFFIMRDASGRHFPVFVGRDRLMQRGVHWHFNCVG